MTNRKRTKDEINYDWYQRLHVQYGEEAHRAAARVGLTVRVEGDNIYTLIDPYRGKGGVVELKGVTALQALRYCEEEEKA